MGNPVAPWIPPLEPIGVCDHRWGDPGKLSREDETRLINAAFDYKSHGQRRILVPKMTGAVFEEVQERKQQTFMKQYQEGVGYDEAKTKCGNSDAQLTDAIQTGRVIQRGDFPFAVYFFKKISIGMTHTYSMGEVSKKSYESTDTMHNTMGKVIQGQYDEHVNFAAFGGKSADQLRVGDMANNGQQPPLSITDYMQTPQDGNHRDPCTDNTLDSLLTRCMEQAKQLEKAIFFADKWITRMRQHETYSARFAKAIQELRSSCEVGDEMLTKLNRARKYRKDPDGKPVTCPFMGALLGEVEAQFRCVAGDFKCAKFHAPKENAEADR